MQKEDGDLFGQEKKRLRDYDVRHGDNVTKNATNNLLIVKELSSPGLFLPSENLIIQ